MKKLFNNPDSQEREYTRLLLRYSKKLQSDVNALVIPEIGTITRQFHGETKTDGWIDYLTMILTQLGVLSEAAASVVISKLPGQFNEISKFNDGQFKAVVKANTGLTVPPVMVGAPSSAILGVNVFRSEPFLAPLAEGWVSSNTALIKSIPTQLHSSIGGILQRGTMNGESVKTLQNQIKERFAVSDYRAKLIAQDQTLKLNADLTRYRVQSVGAKNYIWRTVQDSRVRSEHAYRNGNTYSIAEGANGENPGEPVRCRCRLEAIFPENDD